VTLTGTFKVAGVLTDPTTAVCTVKDPSGNDTTPAVSNPSTGVHTATVTLDEAGYWKVKWTGTGTAAGINVSQFYAEETWFDG
jgi:hypothetical protein